MELASTLTGLLTKTFFGNYRSQAASVASSPTFWEGPALRRSDLLHVERYLSHTNRPFEGVHISVYMNSVPDLILIDQLN